MMLAHPQLDTALDFSCQQVNTMVIENPRFFRDFLRDINTQIQGYSGLAVLSENDKSIPFAKHVELVDSFLSFGINRKSLLTKLLAHLEATAVDGDHYVKTAQLIAALEQHILDLTSDLPFDVVCAKINVGNILRAVGIELPDDYENDLERLLDFMELTRELDRDKLFILVNLRSYYADEDISAFLSTIISHEYHVLLVDSSAHALLLEEKRTTIDVDLCEF